MNNLVVFAGQSYYPRGGINDYKGKFHSREEALRFLAQADEELDWYQIVSSLTFEIVEEWNRHSSKS